MSDRPHARQLLDAALKDIKVLPVIIDSNVVADEIFGYHVQQAAEKCFKAWLSEIVGDYPYTHDISRLLAKLEKLGCDIEPYEVFVAYSIFSGLARYVGLADDDEDLIDRENIIIKTQDLYNRIDEMVKLQEKSDGQGKSE